MSNTRSLVIKQIHQFLNLRHPIHTILFCLQANQHLLESIKQNFLKLSSEDQDFVVKYHDLLYNNEFTPEQHTVIKDLEKNFIASAGISSAVGWLAGKIAAKVTQQNFQIKGLAELIGLKLGFHPGIWVIIAAKHRNVDVNKIKCKMENMLALTRLFNSITGQKHSMHAEAKTRPQSRL